jgi:hypothetical protein
MEDLVEAITCHRQALTFHPLGHPNRPSSLIILANAVPQSKSNDDLLDAAKYLS